MSTRPGHALVTGASSGIGLALARAYAARGVPLILTARRVERLQAIATELSTQVPVAVIPADLAEPDGVDALVSEIEGRDLRVRILVNNAGYGVAGRYRDSDWPVHARFLRVMVEAPCDLAWRLLPQIRSFDDGRILNIASFAALMPAADGQTLYAPAKAFMVSFSQALSLENADRRVLVSALCPGFTRSEFHDVTGTREKMRVADSLWLDADDVARAGIEGNERGEVIIVPGWRYRLLWRVIRLLPPALALRLIARNSAKMRPL